MNDGSITTVDNRQQEVWEDIPGWEGLYQASSFGRIKRLPIKMIYSDGQKHYYPENVYNPSPSKNGYRVVCLHRPGEKPISQNVHRLIAETFIAKEDGCDVVNHIDGDRGNNNIRNLEWTTYSGNSIHAIHRRGSIGAIVMKPVVCIETGDEFDSSSDAARWLEEMGVKISKRAYVNIWAAASMKRKVAYGFHWKFKENK